MEEITNVAVIVVEFTTVRAETVTSVPVPETAAVIPNAVKLVPVSVTGILVLRKPMFGAIAVSVGGGGATIVNGTGPLVPPGVVTATFLAPSTAFPAMVRSAVTVVFVATMLLAVTPDPETLIPVAPVSPAPVNVTGTMVPAQPVAGLIATRTGIGK